MLTVSLPKVSPYLDAGGGWIRMVHREVRLTKDPSRVPVWASQSFSLWLSLLEVLGKMAGFYSVAS